MTSFDDLPEEAVRRIFYYCTQRVLYELLKSKTYAAIAYSIFYENVVIEKSGGLIQGKKISQSYHDRGEFDPFEAISVGFEPSSFVRSVSFNSSKELVLFYKTHPLFEPNCLIYTRNSRLKELEKLKPGFLKKFKSFKYLSDGFDDIEFDVSDLKHATFVTTDTCEPEQYPKHVESIINPNQPSFPMPSVKDLVFAGTDPAFESYHNFPNLEKLLISGDAPTKPLDIPSLKCLTLVKGEADLSKLTNLEILYCVVPDSVVVGYTPDCKLRLPEKLQFLSVQDIGPLSQLNVKESVHLKHLAIVFIEQGMDISSFEFPPNLIRLSIDGVILESRSQQFPKSLELLTARGFSSVEDPILPPTLTVLSFIDTYEFSVDLEKLPNLSTFATTGEGIRSPKTMENLFRASYDGRSMVKVVEDTSFMIEYFVDPGPLVKFDISPSLNTLLLQSPCVSEITGGKNLATLELHGYYVSKPISLSSLTSLRSLTLDTQMSTSYGDSVGLPVMPSSVEALTMKHLVVEEEFIVPENLKFLECFDCAFKEPFSVNERLEVLLLRNIELSGEDLFKNVGKYLDTIDIERGRLGTLKADFTGTNLQRFSIDECEFEAETLKFPSCLKLFRLIEDDDDEPERSFLDWADISLCDELGEIYCTSFFSSDEDERRLAQFMAKVTDTLEKPSPVAEMKSLSVGA